MIVNTLIDIQITTKNVTNSDEELDKDCLPASLRVCHGNLDHAPGQPIECLLPHRCRRIFSYLARLRKSKGSILFCSGGASHAFRIEPSGCFRQCPTVKLLL